MTSRRYGGVTVGETAGAECTAAVVGTASAVMCTAHAIWPHCHCALLSREFFASYSNWECDDVLAFPYDNERRCRCSIDCYFAFSRNTVCESFLSRQAWTKVPPKAMKQSVDEVLEMKFPNQCFLDVPGAWCFRAIGSLPVSKCAAALLMGVTLAFPAARSANASWQADCINPGVCSVRICVATREQVLLRCQKKCGRLARTKSVRPSNCTPR